MVVLTQHRTGFVCICVGIDFSAMALAVQFTDIFALGVCHAFVGLVFVIA